MSVAEDDTMNTDERTSLERVREILFGARARDADQRTGRLEARLTSELSALRDEMRRRFADLEAHVREEIESISARVDGEAAARVDATSRFARETREAATGLEQRVVRMDEASARAQRELRRQLLDMTREIGAQIGRVREELLASSEGNRVPDESSTAAQGEQAERPSLH